MRSEHAAAQAETRRYLNHVFGCGSRPAWTETASYRLVVCPCSFLSWVSR